MRRFLVLAFAVAATLSVLANNFIPVSAPAAIGELVYRPAGPSGGAQLSEMRVAAVAAPVAKVPAERTVAEPIAQPDLTAPGLHTASTAPTAPTVVTEPASIQRFVQAQTFRPVASFTIQKIEALPAAVVMPEALALIADEHFAPTSLDAAVAERLSFSAEVSRIEPKFIPLTAHATSVFRSVKEIPLASLPTIIPSRAKLDESVADHNAGAVSSETSPERSDYAADFARFEQPALFVNAAYQAPESSIFHRARYVVEPYAPMSVNALAVADQGHSQNSYSQQVAEREITTADSAIVTEPATAMTEAPSTEFERARVVSDPQAPVSTEMLAIAETHSPNLAIPAVDRQSDEIVAEAAPKQTYVPSFLETLAEIPTAVFQRIGLVAMPKAPAATATLAASSSDHSAVNTASTFNTERGEMLPDSAKIAVEQPVTISTSTAMSADMLKPMSAGPLVDAPMVNENAVASTGYSATPFDRMIDTPDVPEAVLRARPVTISGKAEFSNDLLKPMNASINPFQKLDKAEILSAIQQTNNYCDPNFVGPPIRFSQTVELKLDDLLRQLHQRFGVNFIVGKGIADLPMNIKAGSIPWNVLLRSQLFISGVRARCIDANTIELVENQELPRLQDGADVETRFVKLKFLQRTSSGSVDLAGRGQGGGGQNGQGGGCSAGGGQGGSSGGGSGGGGGGGQQSETAATQSSSKFDKLVIEIEKILGLRSMTESSSGGQGGQGGGQGQTQTTEAVRTNRFVTQIPGRNILVIRATEEEHQLIDQIIARADRPPFQVVVKGLVYTANQDKLRDIGVSTSVFGGTADGRTTGSVVGNTLGAAGTIFDFSTIIGTFDFNVQATALEQKGVLSVKSRPFSTVIDGLCARLNVGRSIPIIIDSSLGGQGALEFIDALNKLDVTPHVIDDENGNPIAVTLELTMFANDVDNSVIARGVPAVSERSIQTQLLLAEDKTAILGGFTVDQASRTVEKTPGLGDIPIIGELFKRRVNDKRVNRLYFAISVDVIPFPEAIRPVDVPGATTDIPSITPEQKKRSDAAEPKQVKGP